MGEVCNTNGSGETIKRHKIRWLSNIKVNVKYGNIWLRINVLQFLVKKAVNLISYIYHTITNVQLGFIPGYCTVSTIYRLLRHV
jgi:hypothetical protein